MRTPKTKATIAGVLTSLSLVLAGCAPASQSDTTNIDFYYPIQVGGALEQTMDDFINRFEAENPDIQVTPVYSGDYNQTAAAVRSAISAGDPPGIAVLQSAEVNSVLDDDLITPISDLDNDQEWFDSFYPAFMIDSYRPDGSVVSIPFQRSTILQYWNKDEFAQAGLDPNKPPQTWDELREYAEKLVKDSDATSGISIPSAAPNGAWSLQALSIQNGRKLASDDGKELYLNDPATVEALQFWQDLSKDGVQAKGTISSGTIPNEFANGKTAIIWTTSGQLTNIRKLAKFNFGVSGLPGNVQPSSPVGGGNLYIFSEATDQEKQAALKLAKFLTQPQILAEWTIASGYVAPRMDAWDTPTLQDYVKQFPEVTVARDQLDRAVGELSTHRRGQIEDTINDTVGAVMNGADVQTAADRGQRQADNILREFQ